MAKNINTYLDEKIKENFLNLIKKEISHSSDDMVYIDVKKLTDIFHITGNYEEAFYKLEQVVKKINLNNLDVRAIKAILCPVDNPLDRISCPIEKIGECDPTLAKILFKVDLDKFKMDDKKETIKDNLKYENGVLIFMQKKIDFNSKPNQKELLDILFQKPKDVWYYDQIEEKWDVLKKLNLIKLPKDYWRTFYTAGDGINTAVAIETGIKDFIEKDACMRKGKIRINPKYV